VRFLGVARPQVLLPERDRRELGIGAHGPDAHELLQGCAARVFDQEDAHQQVVAEEGPGRRLVGTDPPHAGRQMNHDLRGRIPVHGLDALLACQVVAIAPRHEHRGACGFETFNDVGPEEPCPPRNGHGPAGPEPAHRSMARWFEPPRDTPAAARSDSTIERTNSLNDTRGFHPNFSRAFDASPTRMVGSTGRKYLGSWRTCGSQSSPTYPNASSKKSFTECA